MIILIWDESLPSVYVVDSSPLPIIYTNNAHLLYGECDEDNKSE